eukprot:GHVU01229798.1.p1 GENE.GHVU01229798.1~~GHVU01229798.1.p1  ORF type:complete len:117 (+),score=11.15 GHVU01229798.1:558-908(+)
MRMHSSISVIPIVVVVVVVVVHPCVLNWSTDGSVMSSFTRSSIHPFIHFLPAQRIVDYMSRQYSRPDLDKLLKGCISHELAVPGVIAAYRLNRESSRAREGGSAGGSELEGELESE